MYDFVAWCIDTFGAVSVGVLMFAENVFPPIPSELIMPLAGMKAAEGDGSLLAVVAWGSIGSLCGAWAWYWVGLKLGAGRLRRLASRHGRWLTLTPADIDRSIRWFDRYGGRAVLLGRLLPTVRTLISVPAGISEMPQGRFLLFSAAGTATWTTGLAMIGYLTGSGSDAITQWLDPLSTAIMVGLVAVYLYRVVTFPARTATD